MEATGVYWKPVWAILEDDFELLLVNARHVKQVPGRKTDMSDAAWLCQLAEAGLLRASFVPPKPIRALRNLTRYRKTQIQERAREANRLHKALEDTGIKLDCVASDILGVSGRAMLDALVKGTTDPAVLADLARGRLRRRSPRCRTRCEGRFDRVHALWIGSILAHIDFLDEQIASLTEMIAEQIAPFEKAVELLVHDPGSSTAHRRDDHRRDRRRHEHLPDRQGARVVGRAMPRQPPVRRQTPLGQDAQRQQVAGLGPGRSSARRDPLQGHLPRRPIRPPRPRRGHKKALGAVKHSIIVACWHMLSTGEIYSDLGGDYFQRRDPAKTTKRLVAQLDASDTPSPFKTPKPRRAGQLQADPAVGPTIFPVSAVAKMKEEDRHAFLYSLASRRSLQGHGGEAQALAGLRHCYARQRRVLRRPRRLRRAAALSPRDRPSRRYPRRLQAGQVVVALACTGSGRHDRRAMPSRKHTRAAFPAGAWLAWHPRGAHDNQDQHAARDAESERQHRTRQAPRRGERRARRCQHRRRANVPNRLDGLTLVPSCGETFLDVNCAVGSEDPGVLVPSSTGIGMAGTACAGVAFSITPDPSPAGAAQGKYIFTWPGTIILTFLSTTCVVSFTTHVAKAPTRDAESFPGCRPPRRQVRTCTPTTARPTYPATDRARTSRPSVAERSPSRRRSRPARSRSARPSTTPRR